MFRLYFVVFRVSGKFKLSRKLSKFPGKFYWFCTGQRFVKANSGIQNSICICFVVEVEAVTCTRVLPLFQQLLKILVLFCPEDCLRRELKTVNGDLGISCYHVPGNSVTYFFSSQLSGLSFILYRTGTFLTFQ